jgi:glycerol-3-phosphate dehydrogenase
MLSRADAVTAVTAEPFDVLVVGGGITGAGVALDAATRGYSVALVERGDFASGTSSRSSKLVHGGLRYLAKLDFGLVREALLERQLNADLAPHLVRRLPFVVPVFDGARWDIKMGLALNAYDLLAVRGAGRHRRISGAQLTGLVPALAGRAVSGGYLLHDYQTDDARLVLTVLEEAGRRGAVAANRLEAVELLIRDGRVGGARLRDSESGAELEVRAANVVNATGVWADRLLRGDASMPVIRPSRGTHVVVDGAALPMSAGVFVPAGAGRYVFALPWLGQVLIGTTDNDYVGDLEHVKPAADDIAYLLEAVNACFATSLGAADVAAAYAGVRPLIAGSGSRSADLSRRAGLFESASGLVTITGGKLTTWRRMAKTAVDRLVERDGSGIACRTHALRLGALVEPGDLPRVDGVAEAAYAHLAGRYGHGARALLELAAADPALAAPILAGAPDLLAEAAHAARHEQARTVGDALLRRTRLGLTRARALLAPDAGAIERVAATMGAELGWDAARREREAAAFRAEAEAEGILPAP